jgi:hypothetical protein
MALTLAHIEYAVRVILQQPAASVLLDLACAHILSAANTVLADVPSQEYAAPMRYSSLQYDSMRRHSSLHDHAALNVATAPTRAPASNHRTTLFFVKFNLFRCATSATDIFQRHIEHAPVLQVHKTLANRAALECLIRAMQFGIRLLKQQYPELALFHAVSVCRSALFRARHLMLKCQGNIAAPATHQIVYRDILPATFFVESCRNLSTLQV